MGLRRSDVLRGDYTQWFARSFLLPLSLPRSVARPWPVRGITITAIATTITSCAGRRTGLRPSLAFQEAPGGDVGGLLRQARALAGSARRQTASANNDASPPKNGWSGPTAAAAARQRA